MGNGHRQRPGLETLFAAALLLGSQQASAAPQVVLPCIGPDCATVAPVFDHWDEARQLRYGYGMTGRADIAFRWYLSSAEAGDARAMHNVGLMQLRGLGTPRDPGAGKAWLMRAYGLGQVESSLALGNLARRSPGGLERSAAFYRFGAGRGDVRAMHALANVLMSGQGVARDRAAAYVWYSRAAEKGYGKSEAARLVLSDMLDLRERLEVERLSAATD